MNEHQAPHVHKHLDPQLSPANVPDYLEDDFHTGRDHEHHPERPRVAELFARSLARLGATTDGGAYEGALPDLELSPGEVTPEVARELDGLQVTVPSIPRWGTFGGLRQEGDVWTVTLDGEPVALPAAGRLHVTSKAWRAGGGGAIAPDREISARLGRRARVEGKDTAAVRVQPDLAADAANRSETHHAHLRESPAANVPGSDRPVPGQTSGGPQGTGEEQTGGGRHARR